MSGTLVLRSPGVFNPALVNLFIPPGLSDNLLGYGRSVGSAEQVRRNLANPSIRPTIVGTPLIEDDGVTVQTGTSWVDLGIPATGDVTVIALCKQIGTPSNGADGRGPIMATSTPTLTGDTLRYQGPVSPAVAPATSLLGGASRTNGTATANTFQVDVPDANAWIVAAMTIAGATVQPDVWDLTRGTHSLRTATANDRSLVGTWCLGSNLAATGFRVKINRWMVFSAVLSPAKLQEARALMVAESGISA